MHSAVQSISYYYNKKGKLYVLQKNERKHTILLYPTIFTFMHTYTHATRVLLLQGASRYPAYLTSYANWRNTMDNSPEV